MLIGELSRKSGCSVRAIRYYEELGIIAVPERSDRGHRTYTEQHCHELTVIRCFRVAQMGVRDIKEVMDAIRGITRPSSLGVCMEKLAHHRSELVRWQKEIKAAQLMIDRKLHALELRIAEAEQGTPKS